MDYWDCEDKSENIICPNCKHIQDQETVCECVTYWGDDGKHNEVSCESCGDDFMVIEKVTREFGTYKKDDVSVLTNDGGEDEK